jgi:hypothetical protein
MRGCGEVEAFGIGVADASIPAPPTQPPAAGNPTTASQGQSGDLAALNEQFAAWVARQQARDGVVDLADGCRQYIKYREGIPNSAEAPRQASESQAPSFTLASKVAAGDSSFFAKSTALPFAPKIPSPLTEATPATSAAAEEAGDEEDIDPEVCVCVCARGAQAPAPVW